MQTRRSRLYRLATSAILLSGLVLSAPTAMGQDDADVKTIKDRDFDLPKGSKGLQRLAMQLNARERALDRRERTISKRETDLKTTKTLITDRMDELSTLRDELDRLVKNVEDLQDERLAGLVQMTDKMREKQAAPFLVELEEELAVKVIDRMNRSKAGKALAVMTPADAARLAEKLTRPIELNRGAQ
ncbi:MAG: flagellar motility protein MotE (MotC chaperone) [Kiritimatiellia bacterium]|jgi:flagellar motility protein MotE (MotC chaperone)